MVLRSPILLCWTALIFALIFVSHGESPSAPPFCASANASGGVTERLMDDENITLHQPRWLHDVHPPTATPYRTMKPSVSPPFAFPSSRPSSRSKVEKDSSSVDIASIYEPSPYPSALPTHVPTLVRTLIIDVRPGGSETTLSRPTLDPLAKSTTIPPVVDDLVILATVGPSPIRVSATTNTPSISKPSISPITNHSSVADNQVGPWSDHPSLQPSSAPTTSGTRVARNSSIGSEEEEDDQSSDDEIDASHNSEEGEKITTTTTTTTRPVPDKVTKTVDSFLPSDGQRRAVFGSAGIILILITMGFVDFLFCYHRNNSRGDDDDDDDDINNEDGSSNVATDHIKNAMQEYDQEEKQEEVVVFVEEGKSVEEESWHFQKSTEDEGAWELEDLRSQGKIFFDY